MAEDEARKWREDKAERERQEAGNLEVAIPENNEQAEMNVPQVEHLPQNVVPHIPAFGGPVFEFLRHGHLNYGNPQEAPNEYSQHGHLNYGTPQEPDNEYNQHGFLNYEYPQEVVNNQGAPFGQSMNPPTWNYSVYDNTYYPNQENNWPWQSQWEEFEYDPDQPYPQDDATQQ